MMSNVANFVKRNSAELVLFILSAAVYSPALFYGFQMDWDDAYYVVSNRYLDFSLENLKYCFTGNTLGLRTPLTHFSFMLDHLIWRTSDCAFGYRLTNILLHSCCAVLFLRILKNLGIRTGLAFACVFFWAVQPQRLESVIWIAERKDVLSGFFALAAFLVFMKNPGKPRNILISLCFFILSLLAKPSAIGLPLVAGVWLCSRSDRKIPWKTILAGAAGMAAVCLAVMKFLHFHPAFIPMPRFFSVLLHNALFYSVNGIFPWETNPCYPFVDWHDFWLVPAAAALLLLIAGSARYAGLSRKTTGIVSLSFGIVFAALFLPFTGVFEFNPTDYADRYAYFPNLAVWAFLGFFLELLFRKKEILIPKFRIAGILLGCFTVGSLLWHMPFWKDSRTLARWAVYSFEHPNDKFILIHAKYGFKTQDPAPIMEAIGFLRKKQLVRNLPRETGRMKEGRAGTIAALELSADILNGNFRQAADRFDRFIPDAGRVLLIEKDLYESNFKFLLMQLFVITKDEQRLAAFENWGSATRDRDGNIKQDYAVTAFLKFHRKDYKGAIADWKELLKSNPKAPDVLENIRRAEEKLKAP